MSTNSLWTDIKKNYFKSADIKIFPSVDRDLTFDRESRLNTEYNFTKMSNGGFSNRDSYIKSWKDDDTQVQKTLKCNIAGYHFDINTVDYTELLVANKYTYLVVEIHTATIATNENASTQTRTYKIVNQNNNTNTSLDNLDGDAYYFHGLSYIHLDSKEQASLLTHTIDDTLNYNDLTNEINNKFYYLLLIGNNGSKADESFLPEINTLDNGGIVVYDIDTMDTNGSLNTGEWLADHLVNTSGGYFIGSTVTDDKQKVALSLNLQTSDVDGVLMPDAERMEYYQVQGIYADASKERTILGVKVPAQTWRPIKVNGTTLLEDNTGSIYNLNLKSGNNTKLTANNGEIEINTTDSYHRRIYSSGLQISTPVGDNLNSNEGIFIPKANTTTLGAVKVAKIWNSEAAHVLACDELSDMPEKRYGVESDSTGKLFVHIPWIDHTNQINKLQAEIETLKDKMSGITTEVTTITPWSTEPTMELYDSISNDFVIGSFEDFSEGVKNCFLPISESEEVPASDLEDLAGYKLRIYPNVITGASSILNESDISIKDSAGFFEFNETSNSYKYTQSYKEFSISPTEKAISGALSVGNINVSITYSGNNISPKVYKNNFKMQAKINDNSSIQLYESFPTVELLYHEHEEWPDTPLKLDGNGEALRLRVYHNKAEAENISIESITPYIPIKLNDANYSKSIFDIVQIDVEEGTEYWEYELQFTSTSPWSDIGEYVFEPWAYIVYKVTDQNGNTTEYPITTSSSVYEGTSGTEAPDVFWANTNPSFTVKMGDLILDSNNGFTIEENNTATYNTTIGNTPNDVKNIIFAMPQPKTGVKLVTGSGSASTQNISITSDNYDWMAYGYSINDTNNYTAGKEYEITYIFKIKYEHIWTAITSEYTYTIKLEFKVPGGAGNAD